MSIRKIDELVPDYTASHSRRQCCSQRHVGERWRAITWCRRDQTRTPSRYRIARQTHRVSGTLNAIRARAINRVNIPVYPYTTVAELQWRTGHHISRTLRYSRGNAGSDSAVLIYPLFLIANTTDNSSMYTEHLLLALDGRKLPLPIYLLSRPTQPELSPIWVEGSWRWERRSKQLQLLPLVKVKVKVKVKVTLRQTVSQYVLVSSPNIGHLTIIFFSLKVPVLSFWSALSDERSGLSL
jgi:hypothetical protein